VSTEIAVKPISNNVADTFSTKAVDLSKEVAALKIIDQPSYENAAGILRSVKAMAKEAEDERKKITRPLDEAKDAVMALFNPIKTRLENAESVLKNAILTYSQEQERKRRIEEERLAKEAKEREEKEKARLLKQSEKALESGNLDKAVDLEQQAQEHHVPAPTIASPVQKVAGLSYKTVWKARIIDYKKIPIEMLFTNDAQKEAHQSYFNALSEKTKGSLPIPGVEFYYEKNVASR
jgi:hypothetical protein